MHDGKYQCHMAASCTYHLPSSPSCSTRAIQKKLTLDKKYLSFLEKKSQENGPLAEKWQDRKSKRTRQKKTREETGKGNQMTALRFQTSPASLRGPPTRTHTNAHIWCCNPPPPPPPTPTHTHTYMKTHTHIWKHTHTRIWKHTRVRACRCPPQSRRNHIS